MDFVLVATLTRPPSAIRTCVPDQICCIVLDSADSIRKIFRRYQFCGVVLCYDDTFAKAMDATEVAELIGGTQPVSCRILLYAASDQELAQRLNLRGFSVTTRPAYHLMECHDIMKDWRKRKRGKAIARAASV